MSAYDLYYTWNPRVQELLPHERITRVRNVTWMLTGLHLSQSVHLSDIARKLPFDAKLTSTTDRFRRLMNNKAFHVRRWYRPIAEDLLARAAVCGTIRLIVDGTKVGAGHQLLMVAVAYRKRTLPIAWTWVRCARGHSPTSKQLALLRYVYTLVPTGASVVVVGDCEFGSIELADQLDVWHWEYVLRKKSDTHVSVSTTAMEWQHFGALVTQRNELVWYDHALVTRKHLHHARLLGYWESGEKEPWLLMTNLSDPHIALKMYRKRMWIEEMFGDFKGHGLDLEKTHLRTVARLSRLVFLVALWYLWLVTRGSQVIKSGHRPLVDRRDRRDLSIFRIGLYFIDRLLAHGRPFAIRLIPYF